MHLEKQNQNRLVRSYRRHVRRKGEAPSDRRSTFPKSPTLRSHSNARRARANGGEWLAIDGEEKSNGLFKNEYKEENKESDYSSSLDWTNSLCKNKTRSTSSEIIATTQNRGQFRSLLECPSRRVSRSEDRRKEAVRRLNVYTIPGISRRSIG